MILNSIIPNIIYGTAWKEDTTERCARDALACGFRSFDTANQRKHYFEAGLGEALRKADIPRAELFIQTKFTFQAGQDHRLPYNPKAPIAIQVKESFQSSLEHLHTDYLDSYVLHGPNSSHGLDSMDIEAWGAMEELADSNKALKLGISNVSLAQLQAICSQAKIRPAFVQNRCYARRGWDQNVREFCHSNGIIYQGFSLLTANPEVLGDPQLIAQARANGLTPAQAVFQLALDLGILPLTGTTDPKHMKEDLAAVQAWYAQR